MLGVGLSSLVNQKSCDVRGAGVDAERNSGIVEEGFAYST